ncbi:endonuclease/exonuclease/phosphatase family protein [Nocardioides flavescens]|uniref:Endonuclease/exonuclease/phosphatase domain-containing protein n=1 Tax=Nocardioides flavescens TaxID=2691959 RepID=A0A6L7ER24_9ACTN|nr:endonuclease/exonuclease/phosphatase family protein [Nocardioides flavescens]MXG89120.1 hypothetical protein [Nocardioides flavescens]
MKRKLLTTLIGLGVGLGAVVTQPATSAAMVSAQDTGNAAAHQSASATKRVNNGKIIAATHNIAGDGGGATNPFGGVYSWIDNTAPDVVAMQEVCESQKNGWARGGANGYTIEYMGTKTKNCGSHGNAIAVRAEYPQSNVQRFWLPGSANNDGWGMICVDFTKNKKFRACSTHLIAGFEGGDDTREAQAAFIANKAANWISNGFRVVIMGDFNAPPASATIKKFAANNGSGQFYDADYANPNPTKRADCSSDWNRKYDYVFMSTNLVNPGSLGASYNSITCSDHRSYQGTGTIKNQ